MAYTSSGSSSSSDSEVDSCSKSCVKAYATLKEQYDSLSSDYKKSQFNLVSYKAGLQSVEDRLVHYKKNEAVFEESINVLKLEVRLRDNALDEYKMKLEKAEKERDQLKQTLEKFQNSSKSLNDLLESQVIDKFKTGLGYNAATPAVESFVNLSDKSGSDKGYHSVPPPLTWNFIPRKPDLTFMDEIVESENLDVTTVVTPSNVKTIENKDVSNTVESNVVRMNNTSAPIIEDWNFDDESEVEHNDKTVRPSTEKIKSVKTVRETNAPKQNKHHPRGNQRNWNNLMSQRLGSDFKMINKACFYGTINTARSRAAVNVAKPKAVHNDVKRNKFHDVKASACWVWKPKNRVIDHGRYEHEPEFDFDAANVPVTTAGAEISTASPEVKTAGDSIEDIAAKTLVYIIRSAVKAKDKAVRLQDELDKEERQKISRAEGLKIVGYRVTTAGSRLLLLNLEGEVKFLMYPRLMQVFLDKQVEGMSKHEGIYVTPSHTKKIFVNMKREGKGTMMVQAIEDMGEDSAAPTDSHSTPIITQPSSSKPQKKKSKSKQRKDSGLTEPILDEATNEEPISTLSCDPPQSAKTTQAKEIASLNKRVKQLEKRKKSRTSGLKRLRKVSSASRVESSNDVSLGAQEDASKQGRKIADLDADVKVTSIDEAQERYDEEMLFDVQDDLHGEEVVAEKEVSAANPVTTVGEVVTTAIATTTVDELTLAQTLIEIKAAKLKAVTTAT
ncbi:hypothetical protein Tco_0738342, partial [Tanacetum coccineum]